MGNTKCEGGKGFLPLWLPVILYAGLIFYLSSLTPTRPLPLSFGGSDKVMHFFIYLFLAFLLGRALYSPIRGFPRARFLLALALACLYGASDEFHQYFVPGREASGLDWLADAAGSAAGVFLYQRTMARGREPRAKGLLS